MIWPNWCRAEYFFKFLELSPFVCYINIFCNTLPLSKDIYHIHQDSVNTSKTPDVATNPIPNIYDRICRLLKNRKNFGTARQPPTHTGKKTIFGYANSFLKPHKKHYPSWQYSMFEPFNQFLPNENLSLSRYDVPVCYIPPPHLFTIIIQHEYFCLWNHALQHTTSPRNTLFYVLWLHIENGVMNSEKNRQYYPLKWENKTKCLNSWRFFFKKCFFFVPPGYYTFLVVHTVGWLRFCNTVCVVSSVR